MRCALEVANAVAHGFGRRRRRRRRGQSMPATRPQRRCAGLHAPTAAGARRRSTRRSRRRAPPRARSRCAARARCPATCGARARRAPRSVRRSCGCPIDGRGARQEHLGEARDLAGARAQRRDREHARVQAEEQILPEALLDDALLEIAVGRGDDAHVDLALGGGADATHRVILEDAQELRLHRHRELADLVEEERAALCRLDEPRLRATPRRRTRPSRSRTARSRRADRGAPRCSRRRAVPLRPLAMWMARAKTSLPLPGLADEQHVDAALGDATRLLVELTASRGRRRWAARRCRPRPRAPRAAP